MRTAEREVDGRELDREERERALELERDRDERIGARHDDADHSISSGHRDVVLTSVRAILERRPISLDSLGLGQREQRALEALKAAVDGREPHLGQFVYATDRSAMLEQALAVLQPVIAELPASGRDLVDKVGELRHSLHNLRDAQDDELDRSAPAVAKAETDSDDKPSDARDDDAAAAKPASSLYGEELPERASALTSLGEPSEVAGSAPGDATTAPKKKPWWRRPFGG